jgi:ABC-type branched-subunit amino acid transport system substrate-binding protein
VGRRTTLELISYDTKSDPNTARSAVERLISQDKVNVIFGDMTASNWATETEAAKVLALVGTPLTDVYKPEYKYTYVTSKLPTEAPVRLGYLPTYMGKPINLYVLIFPDDPPGQNQMKDVTNTLTALGQKYEVVTFPASTTDFSAVATKALSLNGDCVIIGAALRCSARCTGLCREAPPRRSRRKSRSESSTRSSRSLNLTGPSSAS